MTKVVCCLTFLSIFFLWTSSTVTAVSVEPINYYAVDVLDDGQIERRFHLNGVALKETAAVYTLNGTK